MFSSLVYSTVFISQNNTPSIKPDADKKFDPYIVVKHGGTKQFEEFKKNNYTIYRKELWYYSESFYIKRDKFTSGISLDESIIDISRFENQRKQNEEVIIEMPGFKDVLVLLPSNKLMFKPE